MSNFSGNIVSYFFEFAQWTGDCERFAFQNARFFLISFLIDEFVAVGSDGLILMIYLVNSTHLAGMVEYHCFDEKGGP